MNHKRIAVFGVEDFKAASDDDGAMLIEGTITTEDPDRQGERMRMSGLRNIDEYLANPIVRWQHCEPIGHAVDVKLSKTKIRVRDSLASTALVLGTVWPLCQHGSIKAFSIGFYGHDGDDVKGMWEWNDWSLLEHSLVDIPANPAAQAAAIKSMAQAAGYEWEPLCVKGFVAVDYPVHEDTEAKWDATAAEKRVRAWAGAEDGPNDKYRSCFAWYDADAPDVFTSYKLGMCDVFDGKPHVLFRACAAIMGRMGQTDMPAADKAKVMRLMMHYYEQFDMPFPEKSEEGRWIWRAGEQRAIEANLFLERLRRIDGATQGLADITAAWAKAGLNPLTVNAAAAEDLESLVVAGQRLESVLRSVEPVSEADPTADAIEAAWEQVRAQDPVAQLCAELGM